MKSRLSIQQRIIFPIILLGIVALISNTLSIYNINHVNANAADIADHHMKGSAKLADIRRLILNTHKMALSHIVATDYDTMITVVRQIKEEEKKLDNELQEYKQYVGKEENAAYQELLQNYGAFKHALVSLVCASADSRSKEAYGYANGDVSSYARAAEQNMEQLDASIRAQTKQARERLMAVHTSSILIMSGSSAAGVILVVVSIHIILKYVIKPMKQMMQALSGSSVRMNGVVGEVLERTRTSNQSAKSLYSLIASLSKAIKKVAHNASEINGSVSDVNADVNQTAQECGEITKYASQMKQRASEMEQTAQTNTEIISEKVADILGVLNEAIANSRSVDQINSLTKDILSISSTTNLISLNASVEASRAGEAGRGFAVVASEIRGLADSCATTATHIQEVNQIVTHAVHNLSEKAQELVDYLNDTILTEFQVFMYAGQQYKNDASYIERVMESFSGRTEHLKHAMAEIAASIERITAAIDDGAGGITGAAGSTRSLVGDMAEITRRMDVNHEIVEELKEQTEVFSNL